MTTTTTTNHNIHLHTIVSCTVDDNYNPTLSGLATAKNIHNGNDEIYFWKAHICNSLDGYNIELYKNGTLIRTQSYEDIDLKTAIISTITAHLGE